MTETAVAATETAESSVFETLSQFKIGEISLSSLLAAILTFVICFIVIKIITAAVNRLLGKSKKLDATLRGFVASAIKAVLWVVAAIIVANALGINTSSLVALVSVIGLALSLSVQNVLSNLFSGLTLLVTKPFAAGDFVEVAGKQGVVKTIGLFYTQLDTLDNVAVSIPNGDVTASSVNNFSREPLRRVDQYFCAAYDEDTEKKGLGTPATRAATIEALVKNGYVERVGKQLRATDKGKELVTVVPDEVKSAKLTAEWESKLQQIEHGSLPEAVFMSGITQFITEMCSKYGSVDKSVSLSDGGNEPIGKCPKCGAEVVKGKFGYYCKGKCGMNIAKVYGVELSDTQVKGLLDGKSTSYTSKGKKTIVRPEIVENPYNGKVYYQWRTERGK